MGYLKRLAFERTAPQKRRDNLVSSDYTDVEAFVPTYDAQCEKPNMFLLMSMEYQRVWEREKNAYFRSNIVTGTVALKPWLRGHARKHQHNIPRLAVPYCAPAKKNTKYDHVKPTYNVIKHYKPRPCIEHRKRPAAGPNCLCLCITR